MLENLPMWLSVSACFALLFYLLIIWISGRSTRRKVAEIVEKLEDLELLTPKEYEFFFKNMRLFTIEQIQDVIESLQIDRDERVEQA